MLVCFVNSSFYQQAESGTLLPTWTRTIKETEVPLVILGDPAYLLLPWLMKPFQENPRTSPEERNFNYRQSRARMVVKNSFGRLKGRWRRLLKRIDSQLPNVPHIVASCVTLHNICETYGDNCLNEWVVDEEAERATIQSCSSGPRNSDAVASDIRNAIKDYLQ